MYETIYSIYKHTSNISGKSYVGVTINLQKRWITHKSKARLGSPLHFHRAIRKYGDTTWNTVILYTTNNENNAYLMEKEFIEKYQCITKGYNMSEGGKKTPTLRGSAHPLFGKPRSAKTRKKISDNHANVSGPNNSNSKTIYFKDTHGTIYETYGTSKQFCMDHNIGFSTMRRQLDSNIKPNRGSFVGWEVWR